MRSVSALAFLLLLLLAPACSPTRSGVQPPAPTAVTASQEKSTPFPITITDDAGRRITVPAEPRRIVSISASNTEILCALGLEDRLVGLDQHSDYPESIKSKPRVGGYVKPDLEKVMVLEPDLIVATGIHVKAVLPEMEGRGLPIIVVDPGDLKGVLEKIRLVGSVTGRQAEAETLVGRLQARVESVETRLKGAQPVRVFYELSPSLHTAGPGSFVDDLIRLAGGQNIAAGSAKEWPQLSQEAIFEADPEVVLLADHGAGETPERVAERPGWKSMSAVKNGRVHVIEPNLTNRPGPRVVDGLELMAMAIHPERMR